ncbi:hypothetical protein, partial [Bacillus infantis]|uniref:hypothetical protein n=1 Tax=Bacillus infantis TaxID=324767 RepID=UPI00196A4DF1
QLAEKANGNVFRTTVGAPNPNHINIIEGYSGNAINSDVMSSTISGGGSLRQENIIGGNTNTVGNDNASNVADLSGTGAHYAVIGGGYDNVNNGLASIITGYHCKIEKEATHGTISGGSFQRIVKGDYSTIGGGTQNEITQSNAVIAGGNNNKAAGINSAILGGSSNEASAQYATVLGGVGNKATANNAIVNGGSNNTASAGSAVIGGGSNNTASQSFATVAGGFQNTASQSYAFIAGGRENQANALYSSSSGRGAKAKFEGQKAHADGYFVAIGDAQFTDLILRMQSIDATSKMIGINGVATAPQIEAGSAWAFAYRIIARSTTGDVKSWRAEGVIKRDATGNASLVGSPVKTVIGETTGASTWDVTILAGSATLNLNGIGASGTTINWVAKLETIEVIA